ncbi:MAPEG family protein [Undibacterium cyanobacteriorum]|uniref:MAPEG family protein n=1 Tax=Undibacterium cyanobacteriorum TaxID=3073561 RepID=A0ABY9RI19_9BURK|nr:MAPEG family protein [Undibacterium sp. 20NA77.5]WMW80840.1 MAPEG family protein [Undibacterium sp. 20NA77.5]
MSIANWCVLAACVLPVVTVGLAKGSLGRVSRKNGGYDNHHPREWEQKLTGWQQRAIAAQNNGFEALPLFIAGVLIAQQNHANQATIDMLALGFIAVRCAYVAAYLADKATLRSIVWAVGVGLSIALFCIG